MKDTDYIEYVNTTVKERLEMLYKDIELLNKTISIICKIFKGGIK